MKVLIGLLLPIFCLIALPVLGLGIGIGYALAWLLPGVDPGLGIVAGAIFAVGIIDFFVRLGRAFPVIDLWDHWMEEHEQEQDEDQDEEDEQEEEPEEPKEPVVRGPREIFKTRSSSGRRKRRR